MDWLIVGIFVIITTTAIQRIYFHPLAKYPGPLLAKLTGWRDWYHVQKGDRHLDLWRAHENYGPVVRISPETLSINTPGALVDIYANRKANVQKSSWYSFSYTFTQGSSNTHSEVDRDKHAVKRRLLSKAFSDNALHDMERLVTAQVDRWCDLLGEKSRRSNHDDLEFHDRFTDEGWSEPKNMADWTSYLTLDILGELCFGRSFETMTKEEYRFVPSLTDAMMQFVYIAGYLPIRWLLPPIFSRPKLARLLGGDMVASQQKFMEFARNAFADREAGRSVIPESKQHENISSSSRKDFFYHLFNGIDRETGSRFTPKELAGESELLIIAGSGTTAGALSACLFYLVHDRFGRLDRLVREIRESFTSVDEIAYSNAKLTNMHYLRACIDESLRMNPPTPGHLPREVLSGGITVDGMHIPAGTIVGVSSWALFRNEEYFPDAFSFIPERWIHSSRSHPEDLSSKGDSLRISFSQESVQRARSAFAPFSLGTRGCIGKNLAYGEMMVTMAKLLWTFDVKACSRREIDKYLGPKASNGCAHKGWGVVPGNYHTEDIFVVQKESLWLRFRRKVTS